MGGINMEIHTLKDNMFNTQYSEDKRTHPIRILIVDDDTTSEILWRLIISKIDKCAQISWATSFNEAENKIKMIKESNLNYDLIITDIFLSGSNTGIDLWRKYNKHYGGKMILVSAVDPDKLSQHMNEKKEKPIFFHKPLDFDKCIKAINGLARTL